MKYAHRFGYFSNFLHIKLIMFVASYFYKLLLKTKSLAQYAKINLFMPFYEKLDRTMYIYGNSMVGW